MPSLFTACPQKSHMEMFSITIQHGFERNRRSSTLRKRVLWASLLGIFVTAQLPALVHATNGLNLIGSGGISTGLAGADTAVATDFTAMNTNPAGMSQIKENHSGLAITVIKPQLQFMNVANDRGGEDDPLIVPNMGYIHRLSSIPLTLGIGLFTVGGVASDFTDLTTPFGTTDKTGAIIRHYVITPSIAYEIVDQFSLGVSLGISYSDAAFTLLPNTAVPANPSVPAGFSGFEIKGNCTRANGLGLSFSCPYAFAFRPKFGAMYAPHEMVTFGLVYTMKAILPYANGEGYRNQPIGPGGSGVIVNYDVDASGFKWPDDIAFGIALRPTSDLLVSTKFQWINWDAAMNTVYFNFRNGDNAAAPNSTFVNAFNWDSQFVVAIGAAYDVDDRLNIRGGYNYGNDPVPDSTLDPTTPTIAEHHITVGAAYNLSSSFTLDGAFDYVPTNKRAFNSALWGASNLEVGGFDVTVSLTWWDK